MADAQPFSKVKLICGIISGGEAFINEAERRLRRLYGEIDLRSPLFAFDQTDYYQEQMGQSLKRKFLSFQALMAPDRISGIKLRTNLLEEEIRKDFQRGFRIVNIDPGYLNGSALIMATAKNFAHRVPLERGIYAHLEFLFRKDGVQFLNWTYPDYKKEDCQSFFLEVRKRYLRQMRELSGAETS